MKKRTKLTTLGLTVLAGALLLSGCTSSFCSEIDRAHFLYAFDYGVTDYYDHQIEGAEPIFPGNTNVYYLVNVPITTASGIGKANEVAATAQIEIPTDNYFVKLDQLVLEDALISYKGPEFVVTEATFSDVLQALDGFGYRKFYQNELWDNWDLYNQRLREMTADPTNDLTIDDLPTKDYLKIYQNEMNILISKYRSCIAIETDDYGYYGYANGAQYRDGHKIQVEIEAKTWNYAWKKGFIEGLFVFPIAWLTETFVSTFKGFGVIGGLAQLLAILLITFIVRSLMLLVTIKQTASTAKMQALQPEITKIQNKFPNADTNNYEKQQLAAEMGKLYKKNKINPLSTLLVMVVQFPVFISVWGALQGSASLSSDALFNLHLSDPINTVLLNGSNWANGSAVAALILFLSMSAIQVTSMLVPQFIQKRKAKQVTKLSKNPTQTQQQKSMKMVTYVMMGMIIFMGFTLPSAMGVYWFVSALFSLVQTLIIEKINSKKAKKKGR